MNRQLRRLVAGYLPTPSIASSVQAELIGDSAATDRERIVAFLNRDDVAAQLASHGVALETTKARVITLTGAEAAELGGRIEALPSGGPFETSLWALLAVLVFLTTSPRLRRTAPTAVD
jgi:hypothetical protein